MPGPSKPFLAGDGGRGGQYVTVPAFAAPGHSSPSNSRTAEGSTVVFSPKGWRWTEAGDEYSKAVSRLTASTMEGAVRRMKTSFGEIYYIRGTADTLPPFDGKAVGDTVRVQDAITLNIVAEWSWAGDHWERMRVSGEQISNLDVGRLTAGSANISELAARKIAADIGRFLEVTTDQLTVTGNASFVNATAHHIWSKIVTSKDGEFERIRAGMLEANSVAASNIRAGALDGQIITGATLQTSKSVNRGMKIDQYGMRVYSPTGGTVFSVDASSGDVIIDGRLGRKDSWSEAYFGDIVWGNTDSDVSREGAKAGVGLFFRSLEDDWWDGALYLTKLNTGTPSLKMQAPLRKTPYNNVTTMRPYVLVSTDDITLWTGYESGERSTALKLNKLGFGLDSAHTTTTIDDEGIILNKKGRTLLCATKTIVWLRPEGAVGRNDTGFYVTPTHAGMGWARSAVWVNNSGVHMSGNKQFTMRVPERTEKTGMWLSHSSTESPYDGIEYWENLTLDAEGRCTWELPDYVPLIASQKAPWMVLSTSGKARLEKGGFGPGASAWKVHVEGEPNSEVSVLVKGARIVDTTGSHGEVEWVDFARRSPWELGPDSPEDYKDSIGQGPAEYLLGGGYYGPAQPPKE